MQRLSEKLAFQALIVNAHFKKTTITQRMLMVWHLLPVSTCPPRDLFLVVDISRIHDYR